MRCSDIKIHAEIPVLTNSNGTNPYFETPSFKDKNPVVYELSAIKDACQEAGSIGTEA